MGLNAIRWMYLPPFSRQPCMPTTPTPSANLLQLLPEAVVQTDALWEITYLNPAWHKLTGHSVEAALGRS